MEGSINYAATSPGEFSLCSELIDLSSLDLDSTGGNKTYLGGVKTKFSDVSCNQSSHATAERCVAAEGQVVTEGPASVGKCGFEELWLMGSAKAKMKGITLLEDEKFDLAGDGFLNISSDLSENSDSVVADLDDDSLDEWVFPTLARSCSPTTTLFNDTTAAMQSDCKELGSIGKRNGKTHSDEHPEDITNSCSNPALFSCKDACSDFLMRETSSSPGITTLSEECCIVKNGIGGSVFDDLCTMTTGVGGADGSNSAAEVNVGMIENIILEEEQQSKVTLAEPVTSDRSNTISTESVSCIISSIEHARNESSTVSEGSMENKSSNVSERLMESTVSEGPMENKSSTVSEGSLVSNKSSAIPTGPVDSRSSITSLVPVGGRNNRRSLLMKKGVIAAANRVPSRSKLSKLHSKSPPKLAPTIKPTLLPRSRVLTAADQLSKRALPAGTNARKTSVPTSNLAQQNSSRNRLVMDIKKEKVAMPSDSEQCQVKVTLGAKNKLEVGGKMKVVRQDKQRERGRTVTKEMNCQRLTTPSRIQHKSSMNPVEDISRPHCLNFSEDASVIAEPAKPGIAMVTPKNRIGRRSLIPTPCYQKEERKLDLSGMSPQLEDLPVLELSKTVTKLKSRGNGVKPSFQLQKKGAVIKNTSKASVRSRRSPFCPMNGLSSHLREEEPTEYRQLFQPTAKVVHSPIDKENQPASPHSKWSPIKKKYNSLDESCFRCTKRLK